jgi:flagellar hook assembly protein FlgD
MENAGKTMIKWNGLTDNGRNAPSGVYFVRCTSADQITTQKILLMK